MTPELTILAYAVALLIVHLLAQACVSDLSKGIGWALGSRDEPRAPGVIGGRLERALRNYLETFPAFAALAIAVSVADRSGGAALIGAQIYIVARVAYVVVATAGTPYLRSVTWLASLAGLLLMLVAML